MIDSVRSVMRRVKLHIYLLYFRVSGIVYQGLQCSK